MMSKRIGVDVDGCLANFNQAFIGLLIAQSGRDLFPVHPYDPAEWHYPATLGYTTEEMDRTWAHIEASTEFWENLDGYPDAAQFLRNLDWRHRRAGDDIYFITSRPGRRAKEQTEAWLDLRGFEGATVLISSLKQLCCTALQLDYYLDDRTENLVDVVCEFEFTGASARAYRLMRPWNRPVYGCEDVKSLAEFLERIKE